MRSFSMIGAVVMRTLSISMLIASLSGFSMGQTSVSPASYYAATPILVGGEAPGTEGGRFAYFSKVVINNNGDMAYIAGISGSKFSSGLFLQSQGKVTKIALTGEPVPYCGGCEFGLASDDPIAINDLGHVAFATGVVPELTGIFVFWESRVVPILLNQQVGPNNPDFVNAISINNKGKIAFSDERGVYVSAGGKTVPIATLGQTAPGTGGGTFDGFSEASINNSGQVAFHSLTANGSGIFLYSGDSISPVVLQGQPAPGGAGTFDEFYFAGPDDSGQILFSGEKYITTNWSGNIYNRFGIYIYSDGIISPIVVVGQKVPGHENAVFSWIDGFALSSSGRVAISGNFPTESMTYLVSQDGYSRVSFFLDGNPPYNTAQLLTDPISLNDSGTMLLPAWVPGGPNKDLDAWFLAAPVSPDFIPADDFEILGKNGLPAGWPYMWNNAGSGEAFQYRSGGTDSYSGKSTFRLHVGPGGGSTFVLSNSIPVLAGHLYALSAEMRYALPSDSDLVCITALQYDDAGKEIAINEVDGVAADNRWTWKKKAIFVQTLPNARSLQIRFGLISSQEAYIDVDDLR